MELCVGATSRRAVEEALASTRVSQIVASRRQVGWFEKGYTGLNAKMLMTDLRGFYSPVKVVRDHGGPLQDEIPDAGLADFDKCVVAGFDGLHLDVCKLPREEQLVYLRMLCERYKDTYVELEIGGERDDWDWTQTLVRVAMKAGVIPAYVVVDAGGYAWNDRQIGILLPTELLKERTAWLHAKHPNIKSKAHNADWVPDRKQRWKGVLDAYNIAPELGAVEIDAWLRILKPAHVLKLREAGFYSNMWKRWFGPNEGSIDERSRCGARYVLDKPEIRSMLAQYDDEPVREAIRDVLIKG